MFDLELELAAGERYGDVYDDEERAEAGMAVTGLTFDMDELLNASSAASIDEPGRGRALASAERNVLETEGVLLLALEASVRALASVERRLGARGWVGGGKARLDRPR